MGKKKTNNEDTKVVDNENMTLNHDGKQYVFNYEKLSDEAKRQFDRANQVATEMVRLDQRSSELKWVIHKYISFVAGELSIVETLKKQEEGDKSEESTNSEETTKPENK